MTLPRGVMGWSAVCECGVFDSYSLYALTLDQFGFMLFLKFISPVVMGLDE